MSSNDGNRSLTSSNKWKYVPGKVYNLTPLNLQDIRKQLLDESDDSDNDDCEEEAEDNQITKILNQSFNAGSPKNESKNLNNPPEERSTEINNSTDEDKVLYSKSVDIVEKQSQRAASFSMPLEIIPENTIPKIVSLQENKENIVTNIDPLNISREKKKDDSFDLDFSALSLHTPVKKVEKAFNYLTPKINIIPPSETKNKIGSAFKTPNVAKKQYSLSNSLFKTPVNKPLMPSVYSTGKQHGTHYSSVKKMTPMCHKSIDISDILKPKPVIYQGEDGSERICVNDIEYTILKMLGRGGSSEVFYGFNIDEKLPVALKVVSLSDPTAAEGYINEVKLLESLQSCDRIIKMYDYEIRDEKLVIVLEKCGLDLSSILKQFATKQSHLPNYLLLFYWMEMLWAVKQIHENGVIHSDLKPANFLRSEEGLKLIDFGIASKVQEDMTCVFKSNQEGSCNYISPEALSIQTTGNVDSPSYGKPKYKVHYKSDVWSLGCILYQLVYRRTPFHHINHMWAKFAAITDPNHKIPFPTAEWVSARIVNTIKKCLQYDVKSRPSVDELIEEYRQVLDKI